ncbi:MAG TPA: phage holin family protein [Fimbriimonadaceae bacterium]|nr:phage holin family protein [Fimbriimonadaceae bacterium]
MSRLLIRWIVMVVSVILAATVATMLGFRFSVQYERTAQLLQLFVGVAVLAFFNATLGKILKLLTLPLNCLTFGLFSFVINAAMLLLASETKLGIHVDGFVSALVGSVLISVISGLLSVFVPDPKEKDD